MNNYDVVIIGAGPAGIFTALEMIRNGSKKKIAIVEKGRPVEKRSCPKTKTKVCMNCKPYCHITTGFSGAGAFSDGKLSLSYEVGGDLPELIGEDFAQEIIEYTDSIYLEFGADSKVEGIGQEEKVKDIRKRAIQAGLKLVDCPIRHLGTEKAQEIYYSIEKYLIQNGVDIYFGYACKDVVIESGKCIGAIIESAAKHDDLKTLVGKHIVVATGRKGADWLEKLCEEHNILHEPGTVDIGVRVEVRNEIMEDVNNVLYESKLIGYPQPFKNKVRTFCQNPGGFVSQENYDDNIAVVNGHSFKDIKSENTNFALLVSANFTEPFDEPIKYGKYIAELSNMLTGGKIMVQRLKDLKQGKRSTYNKMKKLCYEPTLKDAVPGDLSFALPHRILVALLETLEALDKVCPGINGDSTILYGVEVKFYSTKVKVNNNLKTNIDGVYAIGDGAGITRGLIQASISGVIAARDILK